MNTRIVFYIVGMNVSIIGLSILFPAFWSIYYGSQDLQGILISSAITTIFGFLLYMLLKPKEDLEIRYKEGFAIVTFTWILASAFGSLPFLLTGTMNNFADAFFETMSGFTTTGASVLTNIEGVAPGILFWRSLTHWLGGMGIVVLFVAILSSVGVGGFQIFRAESTGLSPDKIKSKISESAKVLWNTYLFLSVIQTILLYIGGMTFFDSLCHTFGTMATGGFSTKNQSVGFYDSFYIQWVIIIFMFLAGVNFALYYAVYHSRSLKVFIKDSEFKLYAILVAFATVITTIMLFAEGFGDKLFKTFTDAAFQVVSVITTTGFASLDYNSWPTVTILTLFALMFIGGCAGSTGGSVKVGRFLILLRYMFQELKKAIHPRAVTVIKIGGKIIEEKQLINVMIFFFMFISIFIISALIISLDNVDFVTALSASAATLTNVGPGFNLVGPAENYSFFSNFSKLYMSFLMLIGRLELYTVLVLLNPIFWKK